MPNILFIYFNHYHDSKTLSFIYFVGLKMHWKPLVYMRPNVEFQIELTKTNPGLTKSHLQWKTHGHTQKPPRQYLTI